MKTWRKKPVYALLIAGMILELGAITGSGSPDRKSTQPGRYIPENNPGRSEIDVYFYRLDLSAGDTSIYLQGSVTMDYKQLAGNAGILDLDLSTNFDVDSVLVNGKPAVYSLSNDSLSIVFPQQQTAGQNCSLKTYYHGYGYTGTDRITGIYNRKSYVNGKYYTYTLSEPFSAKYWFPCKQDLSDKVDSVFVNISTDNDLKAGSNGLLKNTVQLPGNRVRYEWKSYYPIAYYLISFAVGDFLDYTFDVEFENDKSVMPVQNYVYNDSGYFKNNKESIDKTGDLLKLYSTLFGPYPFKNEKYGHCLVPLGGGMEHQTMTSLGNFSFLLVAHELAHQWFGDNVTCATWQDIWVNEGFASYAEYLAREFLDSVVAAYLWMDDAHDFVKSDSAGSVFVPAAYKNDEDRIFDYRLSYKKGAAIIHMIRQEVGNDEMFFSILQAIQQNFRDGLASGDNIKNLLEEKTGKSFERFFQQWYYGEGYPILSIYWHQDNDSLTIRSVQETSSPSVSAFDMAVQLRIQFYNRADTVIEFRQDNNYMEFITQMPGLIRALQFDPYHWLLTDLKGIFKISDPFDNDSLFNLSPNPVTDRIKIIFKTIPSEYTIYITDMSGRVSRIIRNSQEYLELNLHDLNKGQYILLIEENGQLYAAKIIKI